MKDRLDCIIGILSIILGVLIGIVIITSLFARIACAYEVGVTYMPEEKASERGVGSQVLHCDCGERIRAKVDEGSYDMDSGMAIWLTTCSHCGRVWSCVMDWGDAVVHSPPLFRYWVMINSKNWRPELKSLRIWFSFCMIVLSGTNSYADEVDKLLAPGPYYGRNLYTTHVINTITSKELINLQSPLIRAIIEVESSGNPDAISKADCRGLMQLSDSAIVEYFYNTGGMYGTIIDSEYHCLTNWSIRMEDVYDPVCNVEIGKWYLRRLKDHYLKYIVNADQDDDLSFAYDVNDRGEERIMFFQKMGRMVTPHWEEYSGYSFEADYIHSRDDYIIALMLSAYNGGITRLRKNGYDISKMPRETRSYVKKVMRLYNAR